MAGDDATIENRETVVVSAETAKPGVKALERGQIRKGQCLQVLQVQDHWIWTFIVKEGVQTHGWIDSRQVSRNGSWALFFDGTDDLVAVPNSNHSRVEPSCLLIFVGLNEGVNWLADRKGMARHPKKFGRRLMTSFRSKPKNSSVT